MLAPHLGEQEELWGSAGTKAAFPAFSLVPAGKIVAATSLSFLPSALAAGCLQSTQFIFPLQKPNPTLPQLLLPVLMPCRRSPVPVSFSSLYIYALLSLIAISFSCFQLLLPFVGRVLCVSGPGAASPCLFVFPYAHACKFSPLFCSRCLCQPACTPRPAATEKK